jgi:YVTN family beta-propeller protein
LRQFLLAQIVMGVTITPNGTRAYVMNQASNMVSVVDTATNNVVATIPVLSPVGVAFARPLLYTATIHQPINPDGSSIFNASRGD